MKYISTRSDKYKVDSAEAIKTGIAPDGGLFVPEEIPQITLGEIESFASLSYAELAKKILSLYLTDYTDSELSDCVSGAYTSEKFGSDEIAPLHKLDGKASVLELWHGPTCAFKDMALQILPHFLVKAIKKQARTGTLSFSLQRRATREKPLWKALRTSKAQKFRFSTPFAVFQKSRNSKWQLRTAQMSA